MAYNEILAERAEEYLKSQGWRYETDRTAEKCIFKVGMGLRCKLKSCRLYVSIKPHGILSIAVAQINADRDSFDNVVEFITRANYGLTDGCFEFDHNDGEVRYRAFLRCEHGVPDLRDVEDSVDLPLHMFERYGNVLVKNMMGFGDPEKDIAAIDD